MTGRAFGAEWAKFEKSGKSELTLNDEQNQSGSGCSICLKTELNTEKRQKTEYLRTSSADAFRGQF